MTPTAPRRISKCDVFCRKRTRVGRIWTTFTPSIESPSERVMPLITAKRCEGSSLQTIPDILKVGGSAENSGGETLSGLSAPVEASGTGSVRTCRIAFFSAPDDTGAPLSPGRAILVSAASCASGRSRTASRDWGGGDVCRIAGGRGSAARGNDSGAAEDSEGGGDGSWRDV